MVGLGASKSQRTAVKKGLKDPKKEVMLLSTIVAKDVSLRIKEKLSCWAGHPFEDPRKNGMNCHGNNKKRYGYLPESLLKKEDVYGCSVEKALVALGDLLSGLSSASPKDRIEAGNLIVNGALKTVIPDSWGVIPNKLATEQLTVGINDATTTTKKPITVRKLNPEQLAPYDSSADTGPGAETTAKKPIATRLGFKVSLPSKECVCVDSNML